MKQYQRVAERLLCDIPVTLSHGTKKQIARIVDVTPFGAQIRIPTRHSEGSAVVLKVRGQSVDATVMWGNGDRIGVRFAARVDDGPLRKHIEAINPAAYA